MDPALRLERLATPTGAILLVTDARAVLCALDWEDHLDRMQALVARHYGDDARPVESPDPPTPAARALGAYFDGDPDAIAQLPTAPIGTTFQRKVWAALRTIPAGRTDSYGGLASRIGQPKAVRAVGLANGSNPIAIVVPCHRVIGADGSLTGYSSGIERKRWLLAHEGVRA